MNAVIYARFSSAGQREESIEGQVRECTAYALKNGYNIIETYIDRALSATTDRRPAFQQMIQDAEKHAFAVVLCYKHDRFARNRYDAAHYKARLKAHGVSLEYAAETVPEGPEGILIDSVMEGFAEYYSANLSQNVRRGQYDSALKRYTLGVKVFGLREGPDHRYEFDGENADAARRIFEDYAAGRSAKSICEELNARGFRTARGAKFSKNSINKIITNEKYKGVYKFGDIYDEHGVPAIVSPELWQQANEMAKMHAEAPARSMEEGGYLLTGKLFCGSCGSPMSAAAGTGRTGQRYEYYACNARRNGSGCHLHNVHKQETEDRVVDILKQLVFSNEMIYAYADYFMKWQEQQSGGIEATLIEQRLAVVEKKIENVTELLTKVPSVALAAKLPELEKDRADLQIELERLHLQSTEFSRDDIVFFLKSFRREDVGGPGWRIYIINTFLQAAYIYEDGRICVKLNSVPGVIAPTAEKEPAAPPDVSSFDAAGLPKLRNLNTAVYFHDGSIFAHVAG